jgi:hydrogenase maturation protease
LESIENDKVALIGVGNIMFCDEGVGHYLVEFIKSNYDPHPKLTLVDGGVLGFTLMTYFQTYPKVVLVSTSSKKDRAGSIFIDDANEVMNQSASHKTANEAEINMMLEICAFADKIADITMISIIPDDIISVNNGMSDAMFAAFPELLDITLSYLSGCGIELKPKKEQTSIMSVVEKCANPTQEYLQ